MSQRTDLLAALDQPDPVLHYWNPDIGDKVAGTITAFGEDSGKFDPYKTITLDVDGEAVVIRLQHKVLISKIAKLEKETPLRIGDQLAVMRVEPPEGKFYFDYRVRIQRTEAPGEARSGDEAPAPLEPPPAEANDWNPQTEDPWATTAPDGHSA